MLHGTLTLSDVAGLAFSAGDGTADAAMTFTGSTAAINTALSGLTYTPASGYTGADALQITTNDLGNSGAGGVLTDADSVAFNVIPANNAALWLTSNTNATSSSGVSWTDGEVMRFGDPNLAFEPGTTAGTFSSIFDIDAFAADGKANVSALYRVAGTITVGGGADSFALQAGDLLLSTNANETLGGVAVTSKDLVTFRPASPTNYSSGTFSILLNSPSGDNVREVTLVETTLTVGGVTLNPGDFLLVLSSGAYDKDILAVRPHRRRRRENGRHADRIH